MTDYRTAWLSARKRAAEYRKQLDALLQAPTASSMSKKSWAKTKDRSARTANARAAFDEKFLEQAGWDYAYAERLKREFYQDMALKGHATRRRNKEAREASLRERS